MRGAVLVALAAAVGNMLQGWDNSTIAGSLLYIKREFNLQTQPAMEGLIAAMSLIGATIITTISGPVSDIVGRRPLMIVSAVLYFISGLVMIWAPNVYILLLGRLLDGFGAGLAVTLVPVYISETAPSEIRGQLNTFPQFLGSAGMFVSYCLVFGLSLSDTPNWRFMLGLLSIPSLAYLAFTILYLPESPRWLVSKGRMHEAKQILQRLRAREDVSGELALLVEGLGVGREGCIEEYIIGPANDGEAVDKGQVKLYGTEEGVSWMAKPVTGQSSLGMVSRHGSMANQSVPFMDPLVTLFGSVHENLSSLGMGSMRSMILPSTSSMLNIIGRNEHWDDESLRDNEDSAALEADNGDSDDNLQTPLMSRQESSAERDPSRATNSSTLGFTRNSSLFSAGGEEGNVGIGGGWQLAYKYSDKTGKDGKQEGGLQRIYLKHEGVVPSRGGSVLSIAGADIPEDSEYVQASALVSQAAVRSREPAGIQTSDKGPSYADLFEPGVKRALIVGVGLQLLQQVSGINGVLYYTPQILEQAGVAVLLSNMGLKSDSASLFISLLTAFSMLPCIIVAMRLMDVAGRRSIMLYTIPVLIVSLVALVVSNIVDVGAVLHAVISTASVMVYISFFVMGFGAIPNIICSEIFPTRVRGLCITICALTYWLGDITITYLLPVMLNSIGLSGVFAIFAIWCVLSWIFVFLKVPETKGMPLEVISDFFAAGASAIPNTH
ncbi:monosaccharide-sensing protein 2-like [Mercurialis annua]|uniref:monosaccharide-sensing protein 2-like n=1 Tax=Mercurialis annua TaxID=3986 RepID=UPI00215F438E|nr:monosaccharide-sensing protein 2-like [Mercurialis annua]